MLTLYFISGNSLDLYFETINERDEAYNLVVSELGHAKTIELFPKALDEFTIKMKFVIATSIS